MSACLTAKKFHNPLVAHMRGNGYQKMLALIQP